MHSCPQCPSAKIADLHPTVSETTKDHLPHTHLPNESRNQRRIYHKILVESKLLQVHSRSLTPRPHVLCLRMNFCWRVLKPPLVLGARASWSSFLNIFGVPLPFTSQLSRSRNSGVGIHRYIPTHGRYLRMHRSRIGQRLQLGYRLHPDRNQGTTKIPHCYLSLGKIPNDLERLNVHIPAEITMTMLAVSRSTEHPPIR